jgi:hypothetical protein
MKLLTKSALLGAIGVVPRGLPRAQTSHLANRESLVIAPVLLLWSSCASLLMTTSLLGIIVGGLFLLAPVVLGLFFLKDLLLEPKRIAEAWQAELSAHERLADRRWNLAAGIRRRIITTTLLTLILPVPAGVIIACVLYREGLAHF